MDVRNIIKKYLIDNGFDGLCNDDCGCTTDDLAPCDTSPIPWDCVPGYKVPCPGPEDCPADGNCPWHISPKKP